MEKTNSKANQSYSTTKQLTNQLKIKHSIGIFKTLLKIGGGKKLLIFFESTYRRRNKRKAYLKKAQQQNYWHNFKIQI